MLKNLLKESGLIHLQLCISKIVYAVETDYISNFFFFRRSLSYSTSFSKKPYEIRNKTTWKMGISIFQINTCKKLLHNVYNVCEQHILPPCLGKVCFNNKCTT